jgi:hypothetical protein
LLFSLDWVAVSVTPAAGDEQSKIGARNPRDVVVADKYLDGALASRAKAN